MCGIAGRVGPPDPGHETAAVSERLLRALAHRGPDGRGRWDSEDGLAMLVHTRLAVIGPGPEGNQPMASPDGRYRLTYNGEVINYRALRGELEARGESFATGTDTEVILRLFAREGPASFARLRGMFALAIWDCDRRTLHLARDLFGIKPLYYAASGREIAFASEAKTLPEAGLVARRPDPSAAADFLMWGHVPGERTLHAGVLELPAGAHLEWTEGTYRIRPFRTFRFSAPSRNPHDAERALAESVRAHLESDVPVGIFLSGGLDSAAVAHWAAQSGARPVALCVSVEGDPSDESAASRRTADALGIEWKRLNLDAESFLSMADGYWSAMDQPTIDGFNVFAVSRLARSEGLKVALSGLGGDEWFGGYPTFRSARLLACAAAGPAARLAALGLRGSRLRRWADFAQRRPSLWSAYRLVRGIFTPAEAAAMLRKYWTEAEAVRAVAEAVAASERDAAALLSESQSADDGDRMTRLELGRYMRGQLLRDADVFGMASGVEIRVPFVDAPLADVLASVPAAERLKGSKDFLRRMIPAEAAPPKGPKRGFALPFSAWTRNAPEFFSREAPPAGVEMDTWYRRWAWTAWLRWMEKRG